MKRDLNQFPDDENGNVLWMMLSNGDNLATPREVDFSVIFPTEEAALQFAVHMLKNDQKVSYSAYEENHELSWQVQTHPVLEPNHKNISGYEVQLAEEAAKYWGRVDGWGAMQRD